MNDLFLVIFPLTDSRASCYERHLRSTIHTVTIDKKIQVYVSCVLPLTEVSNMYIYSPYVYIYEETQMSFLCCIAKVTGQIHLPHSAMLFRWDALFRL